MDNSSQIIEELKWFLYDNGMDKSSQIIEDLKWFLYDNGDNIVKNEFGFEHGTEFVSWVGDGHSFIIKDDSGEYRVTINKED